MANNHTLIKSNMLSRNFQTEEELLEFLHYDYINKVVDESGIPLWVLDMYGEDMYNPSMEENEVDVDNPLPF